VLVLMAWVYFSSQVLFLGAEFTEVYTHRHGSRSPQPATSTEPVEQPSPLPTTVVRPSPSTGAVAAATGAGLLVGAIGGMIAGVAALIIGVRRATTSITRRVSRG
jgi:hypothetical protein